MKKGEMLNRMLVLATTRHAGQFDKAGKPYILHAIAVMYKLGSDDEELCCIAIGHDLIEDTKTTFQELKEMEFTDRIIEGIRNLTKFPGETEEQYLARVTLSMDSVLVKIADLDHNSDIKRLKGLTDKDFIRMQKYQRMYLYLTAILENKFYVKE